MSILPNGITGASPPVQDLFEHRVVPVGGKITLPDGPGLGLTLNEQVLHRTLLTGG